MGFGSPSVFRGMDDVLWVILILWYVLSQNQPGATLAPLGKICYGPKTKWPPNDMSSIINTL